ncbi:MULTISPECIES: SDR family oxidoreductase [Paenibacillus]|uniref:SDR family oxidoreductase n=1 Tax=Paenibacillus TaxID=44249 RepID=UPI0022B8E127|nr:SDR family oxidoreductase [Paenibacillus caseinilyticus]MCZ8521926.1 SDR family oxidoreductase [Paenibacillus caseinilyticus]
MVWNREAAEKNGHEADPHRGYSEGGGGSTDRKVALVVGAQGVIGRNLIDYLASLPEWEIIGLSRRGGESTDRVRYISVDLLDRSDCLAKLGGLNQVTHIFYAAYQDRPTWAELSPPNLAMLVHVVEAVEAASPALRHVSLMQGYKVYGAHLGPFKTPARESDAPPMPPEFNAEQQRYLEERQKGKAWTWSALRPSVVGGFATGNPMNLALLIAVYATISKELGLPLRFPGKPGAYDKLMEMTDAGLLAKATVWAATDERCANQAFNINNGDLFRWNDMWPKIARYFDMETAPPQQLALVEAMADKEPLWEAVKGKYGLESTPYKDVAAWAFGDFVFSWDYDFFADGSKARRFGFHEYVDTEAMFTDIFDDFRRRRIIP